MSDEITPYEYEALRYCVRNNGCRTHDGSMYDTLLSGLCSKPKGAPLVSWRMNPNSRTDGYINLYEPTEAGRQADASRPLNRAG